MPETPTMARALARNLIVARLPGRDASFVISPLTGEADLLSHDEAEALGSGHPEAVPDLAERDYLLPPDEEQRLLRQAFLRFLDGRAQDEVQVFYVPTYACNFGCGYCFQNSYAQPAPDHDPAVIPAFFDDLARRFAGRRFYVTVFGGEPLLPGPRARRDLAQMVDEASRRGVDLAVVTNGYHLESYLDLLGRATLREIQVTLDGPAAVHDQRRPLKGGGATFDAVVRGIDAAIARGLPINLRVVVDKDNLASLVELAALARAHGWLAAPGFKTQLGRNYELHECQADRTALYDRLALYQAFFELARAHPEVLELHRPSFHVARQLADTGELPEPLFDACPACKTEWAYDFTGAIYPCTATVGKAGEQVGSFYPVASLDEEKVAAWQDRDVLAIPECRDCPSKLVCGGGCGALAKNQHGRIAAPDCRPVPEMIGLGLALYIDDEDVGAHATASTGCACTDEGRAQPSQER
ncbi:MAG: radical SAM protein [Pseudomonadota bacterium]